MLTEAYAIMNGDTVIYPCLAIEVGYSDSQRNFGQTSNYGWKAAISKHFVFKSLTECMYQIHISIKIVAK